MGTIKEKDLIEGDFYVGYWEDFSHKGVTFQYTKDFSGNTHYIDSDGNYGWGPCVGSPSVNYRKPTYRELYTLLDAIVQHEPKWEPKVGDYVKMEYTAGDEHGYWLNTTQQRVFKITKERQIYSGGGSYFGCSQGRLIDKYMRPVTEEEIETVYSLPEINGHKGEIVDGTTIKYGCAYLNLDWFQSSENRDISEMVLSSGVIIDNKAMCKIWKVLNKRGLLKDPNIYIEGVL